MDSDSNRDTEGQGHIQTVTQMDRDTNRQGHKWTGAGTQRDRVRDTNGHGQVYGHGHRQL
jgi:hypothetical protein